MAKKKKYKKVPRYTSRSGVPKIRVVSGKNYRWLEDRNTKASANAKAKRLRSAGYSARVFSYKLKGSEKVYYAIYKRGSRK